MKFALSDLSKAHQAQVSAQLHGVPHPRTVKIEVAETTPAKKRLRQKSGGLNKTEAAFLEYLKRTYPHNEVFAQKVTLLIANGVRFTPDFIMPSLETGQVFAFETKGFMRDDAAVKIKVAASVYPWIKFFLVSKAKGGTWSIQEILT